MPSTSVPPPAAVLTREPVRDADYWLSVVAWLVIVASALQVLLYPFGRDQSIYAVVGAGLLEGSVPYRDLWDFKPPGVFFVYALGQLLFGRSMLAPRLLELGGLLLVVFAFVRLGNTFFGSKRAGLMGGALAVLIHAQLEFWHTAQPEAFGGFLTVGGLLLTSREWSRRKAYAAWVAIGVLFGCAFLLKPHLGGGALVCAAYLARLEHARTGRLAGALMPVASLGAGALVPVGVCAAYFLINRTWSDLSWTLFEFAPGYTFLGWRGRSAPEMFYYALEEGFFRFSALAGIGAIAAFVMASHHEREREGLFLVLGVLSVHFAGIAMQGKFFQYHYSASLPLIAFIAGLGLYKLWRRCLFGGFGGVAAYLAFIVVVASMRTAVRDLPGSFWKRSQTRIEYLLGTAPFSTRESLDRELGAVADYSLDADRRVANEIRRLTDPSDTIYVWGFEPAIYWLSSRRPASRFIYNVPQRTAWGQEHSRRLLMHDLAQREPAIVVVQRRDVMPGVTGGHEDSAEALHDLPELATMLETRYTLVATVEDFLLYQRTARVGPPSAL
jgi:hypothetical protein